MPWPRIVSRTTVNIDDDALRFHPVDDIELDLTVDELRRSFAAELGAGRVLTAAPVVRVAPSPAAAATHARPDALDTVVCDAPAWGRTRELQLALAHDGDHRRVPLVDLVLAAACERARTPLLHYDADYERIAGVGDLEHRWVVPHGTLAA